MYKLLTSCAHVRPDAEQLESIARAAVGVTDWTNIPSQAEAHGLAPLVYANLKAAGVELPPEAKLELQGLHLRHRHANQVRAEALRTILAALAAADIEVMVLKGAALAHLVYPEPGLRPMSDIDLLVRPPRTEDACRALEELGFSLPLLTGPGDTGKHHLEPMSRVSDGIAVNVELHHHLSIDALGATTVLDDLIADAKPFSLGSEGQTTRTLGLEDMLWHLCLHLKGHATVFTDHRLIWMVDIGELARRFAAEIDWDRIRRQYPIVRNTLSLLQATIGMPRGNAIPIKQAPALEGVGRDFRGWPRAALSAQRHKGWFAILKDTFWPSEWWLRLHHGLGAAQPLAWHRWVRHPFEILGWVIHLLRGRAERRRESQN